jgi:glycosyltransferase involved in cell wall biosynthesis
MDDKALLRKLSDGAREQYRTKFTARAMTEQLEALYEKAAARTGRSGKRNG